MFFEQGMITVFSKHKIWLKITKFRFFSTMFYLQVGFDNHDTGVVLKGATSISNGVETTYAKTCKALE